MIAINFGNTFSSVRDNRGLQLYLLSQVSRLWGWAALQVAINWLVYSSTKSSSPLAWIQFGNFVPMLLFGMTGGYVADRFNRKHVLLLTQTLNAMLMLVFAYLAAQGDRQIMLVAFTYVAVGIVYAHDQPVRNALIMNLIPPAQRVNAFCSEMILSTLTMVVGYQSAGFVIARMGESKCFLLAALAFLVANFFVALIRPRIEAESEEMVDKSNSTSPTEAIKYVVSNRAASKIFTHNGLALLFGTKYSMLFPAITLMLLHGNSSTFGSLDAANSVGGACAGFVLMNMALTPMWKGAYAALAGSLLILMLASSGNFVISALVVVSLGFCFTMQNNGNYAVLQTIVPDRLRGRVTAAYLILTALADQVGNFGATWAADNFGVRNALYGEGGLCALVFAVVCFRTYRRVEPKLTDGQVVKESN